MCQKNKWIRKLSKAHKAKVTMTFLKEQNIQVLAHPPYSPDLAPCHFWMLPLIEEKLAGRKYPRIHFRTLQKLYKFRVPGTFSTRLSIFF